jgi:ABC-type amino acid transport system permease subunit
MIFQQRRLAARLFFTGCAIAAASGAAANATGLTALALGLATVGLCGAIWGARRWPVYLIALAVALTGLLPILEPIVRAFLPFWWAVPLLVVIALVAALIVTISTRRLREHVYRNDPKNTFNRILGKLLDLMTGFRRRRRRRDRHIGEFGTKRGKSGQGPHTI